MNNNILLMTQTLSNRYGTKKTIIVHVKHQISKSLTDQMSL